MHLTGTASHEPVLWLAQRFRAFEEARPTTREATAKAEPPMIYAAATAIEIATATTVPARSGRLAACGRPSYVARAEITNEDGNLLGPEQPGEIVVRSLARRG